jgi:hypothetical protein
MTMIADVVTAVAVISLASALLGAVLEYTWHSVHFRHKH